MGPEDTPAEFETKHGRLSRDSERYTEERRELKTFSEEETDTDVFGHETLEEIDLLRDPLYKSGLKQSGKKPLDEQQLATKIEKELEASKRIFLGLVSHEEMFLGEWPGEENVTYSFFAEALKNQAFWKQLRERRLLENIPGFKGEVHPEILMRIVEPKTFPLDLYEQMLRIHAENFAAKQKEFEKRLPQLMQDFSQRIRGLIAEKQLPLDETALKRILEETTFRLADALTTRLKERWGEYDVEKGMVSIAGQIPSEEQAHTLGHEMLHTLSGRTIVTLDTEGRPEDSFILHQRVGTDFFSEFGGMISRFKWLNEAITEKLTTKLYQSPSQFYPKERELMELLLSHGKYPIIEEKFLTDAYFENYDPNHPEKVPAWKTLTFVINKSYRPGFLVDLDKIIKRDGIQRAINLVRNWRSETA